MTHRQTADAKQRFTELVDAAGQQGPQVVMRYKKPVAVVLSPAEFCRLVKQAGANFGLLLAESPFGPDNVDPVGMNLSSAN